MSGKNVIFDSKKVKKKDFYENKKVIKIDMTDVDKIWFQKNNRMVQISRLSISLNMMMMMMMLLDHYA